MARSLFFVEEDKAVVRFVFLAFIAVFITRNCMWAGATSYY